MTWDEIQKQIQETLTVTSYVQAEHAEMLKDHAQWLRDHDQAMLRIDEKLERLIDGLLRGRSGNGHE